MPNKIPRMDTKCKKVLQNSNKTQRAKLDTTARDLFFEDIITFFFDIIIPLYSSNTSVTSFTKRGIIKFGGSSSQIC
jgi:hypothetical protein